MQMQESHADHKVVMCTSQVPCFTLQGDAVAGLAAIASANKTRLPETPLQDSMCARGEQKGLWALLRHARLRKRLLIMLAASAAASQVSLYLHVAHVVVASLASLPSSDSLQRFHAESGSRSCLWEKA